ncbi:MAG: HAD family hydrolase [Chloroflexota bacterium]|nr:MAG: HAD family hydrolase [Chloroflexota bacterium]
MDATVNRAVFLDRDGTLVADGRYAHDPEKMVLLGGVCAGLRLLETAGYQLIVVTNQSGIALDYFTEPELHRMHERLAQLLAEEGVRIGAFYYCPHHPRGAVAEYAFDCTCRKPAPGMLLKAAEEHQIDLPRSWLIGDILDDVEAGNQAGCRSILLNVGTETLPTVPSRTPAYVARDFLAAVRFILASDDLL